MFVDASALTAILTNETESGRFVAILERPEVKIISPLAVWETTLAVARVLGMPTTKAGLAVKQYLDRAEVAIVAIPPEAADLALDAFDRFGKGRHPARLNMGDCFSYACARHYGQPLLYKGDDFALTDIAGA